MKFYRVSQLLEHFLGPATGYSYSTIFNLWGPPHPPIQSVPEALFDSVFGFISLNCYRYHRESELFLAIYIAKLNAIGNYSFA
jgi:hypothetical protein